MKTRIRHEEARRFRNSRSPVTTDLAVISQGVCGSAAGRDDGGFCTYQSLGIVERVQDDALAFDY